MYHIPKNEAQMLGGLPGACRAHLAARRSMQRGAAVLPWDAASRWLTRGFIVANHGCLMMVSRGEPMVSG